MRVTAAVLLCFVFSAGARARVTSSEVRAIVVEPLTEPVSHAEGPHWQAPYLYYLDVFSGSPLLRLDTTSGRVERWTVPPGNVPVALAVPIAGDEGRLLLSRGRELVEFDLLTSEVVATYGVADEDKPGNRFNDGKADPAGRLWAGTMGPDNLRNKVVPDQGSLFLLDANGLTAKVSEVDISNGIAWNSGHNLMYYIDTPTGKVDVFDYDLVTASITNRRTVIDFVAQNVTCEPDGMTIDADDFLWVACWNGWQVVRVDPALGQVVSQVSLPVQYVTSMAWGGANFDDLYVTSSKGGLTPEEILLQPYAGSVFKVSGLGVNGVPSNLITRPF
ncbi:Hypothetical predicted protein [Cloeon dipterum]|uniref:Regucalcin n=1 Tax=Cloeon dipterum TaxID=197152 RepID=A0A8S1CUI3_9INSE|nr:Hypothetical predicted protein [Cloeon dipterum]